jgi:hypothetical protein
VEIPDLITPVEERDKNILSLLCIGVSTVEETLAAHFAQYESAGKASQLFLRCFD